MLLTNTKSEDMGGKRDRLPEPNTMNVQKKKKKNQALADLQETISKTDLR